MWALPGWLWLSGERDIPVCQACARPAAGTRASGRCGAPRRHCIIQGMTSGRIINLSSRTPAGLVKTQGEGKEESSPREVQLTG